MATKIHLDKGFFDRTIKNIKYLTNDLVNMQNKYELTADFESVKKLSNALVLLKSVIDILPLSEPNEKEVSAQTEKERVSTNLRDDGTLEIFIGDRLLTEISDGREDEDFIKEILNDMGYVWNEDGTLTPNPT